MPLTASPPTRRAHQKRDSGLPFLRWVGGKQRFSAMLRAALPPDLDSRVYREPFLGAASVFFAARPRQAILSDANADLIRCYCFIRDRPEDVALALETLTGRVSSRHYYSVRTQYNDNRWSPLQAARFIYLNRTCFNGVFRVNEAGVFNVPYGHKPCPLFPGYGTLLEASRLLCAAELRVADFADFSKPPGKRDFFYLDPPYPALDRTAFFAHYTRVRFDHDDQAALSDYAHELDARGCLILMSNADTPVIRDLYNGFHITSISTTRYVSCKSAKRQVSELLISNYPLPRKCTE